MCTIAEVPKDIHIQNVWVCQVIVFSQVKFIQPLITVTISKGSHYTTHIIRHPETKAL